MIGVGGFRQAKKITPKSSFFRRPTEELRKRIHPYYSVYLQISKIIYVKESRELILFIYFSWILRMSKVIAQKDGDYRESYRP